MNIIYRMWLIRTDSIDRYEETGIYIYIYSK